jgi:hypothetical protein
MKNSQFVFVLMFLSYFSQGTLIAQKSQVGVELGYGKSLVSNDMPEIPEYKDLMNFISTGVSYSLALREGPLYLKSGLLYNYRGDAQLEFHYARMPLGVDFRVGNKVQFIIGGGFFLSYLGGYEGTEIFRGSEGNINRWQWGFYLNIGFGFHLTPKYYLAVSAIGMNDITHMFKYYTSAMAGTVRYTEYMRGVDRYLSLSLYYTLSGKQLTN